MKRSGACLLLFIFLCTAATAHATTKGLSQIVTPDLQPPGDFSLSLQAQSERIANPYQLQVEVGLTEWAELAVFRGFKPDEFIFGAEFGLFTKEPYLLSIGFVNWSPHRNVEPQPFVEAGYYTEHHKFIVGAIHAGYKMRRSSATPTTSTKRGARRWTSRVAPRTPLPSESPGTSLPISRQTRRCMSGTTAATS